MKVTVITPTYNHEKYIGACIDSLRAQTFREWEMIVVDDGSTDSTPRIVGEYQKKDPRIRLFRQENIGIFRLAETYNKALDHAGGEFIAILEGDDLWVERKLEIQVAAFQQNPEAVLCWGQAYSTGSENNVVYALTPLPDAPEEPDFNNDPVGRIMNIFLFRNCIPALTMLIKKESLVKIGGFQQTCGLPMVDLPTLCELAFTGKFIYIPQPLGTWRVYPEQVTKVHTASMMEGRRCLAEKYFSKAGSLPTFDHGIDKKRLKKFYNRQLIISYSRSGRYKLIRKEFGSARKDYIRSISGFGCHEPVWKIRSVIGWIFSLFHSDVEGLSRFLGKKKYS